MTGFVDQGHHLIGVRIDHGRLELTAVLGFGAYGVVYEAIDVAGRSGRARRFAVKCLVKAGFDTRQRQFQRREIALHQLASAHKHVVSMHRMIEQGDFMFVILDYCPDGDLFTMITERQLYFGDDALIKRVFLQILDAVDYCHSLGIFHRDLKPENIMTADGGRSVYLGDFGLATTERISRDFGCGSTFYMSPECQGGIRVRSDGYSTRANDIWSLGVILVNLTCGRNPWRQATLDDETFAAYARDPAFLTTILPISLSLSHVLQQIFTIDIKSRISLGALRQSIVGVEAFTRTDAALQGKHSIHPQFTPNDKHLSPKDAPRAEPAAQYFHDAPVTPSLMNHRAESCSSDGNSLPQTPASAASDSSCQSIPPDEFSLEAGAEARGSPGIHVFRKDKHL